jgi:predicted RND superfamily exporter protein
MARLLAAVIYRWRFPLSAFILLVAIVFVPRANIGDIDNDITAWFSKDDPVYQDYERFRQEFGGTRSLIVALKAQSPDALFSRDSLQLLEQITGDIERVETVQRVDSLATATIVDAVPDGLDVRPLLERLNSSDPKAILRRALQDDLIRGDLVSDDGTVTAIVVSFDEDRIDAVRAGVTTLSIRGFHRAFAPTTTAVWRSARPTTGSRSTTSSGSRLRSCSLRFWRSISRFDRGGRRCCRSWQLPRASSGRSACTRSWGSATTSSQA